MDKLDLDLKCQEKIADYLVFLFLEGVRKESVFLNGFGPLITCINVKLDDEFSLRVSVNSGIIYCSVSDRIVVLQKREWKRGNYDNAIGWIEGYIDGFRQ